MNLIKFQVLEVSRYIS